MNVKSSSVSVSPQQMGLPSNSRAQPILLTSGEEDLPPRFKEIYTVCCFLEDELGVAAREEFQ